MAQVRGGNASYQYDGAGKRRQRTGGGTTTRYRWDVGWNVLNEEDNLGNLTRTHKGRSTAHVDGTNPATRTWRFYVHDHLGSTRGVYNSDACLGETGKDWWSCMAKNGLGKILGGDSCILNAIADFAWGGGAGGVDGLTKAIGNCICDDVKGVIKDITKAVSCGLCFNWVGGKVPVPKQLPWRVRTPVLTPAPA